MTESNKTTLVLLIFATVIGLGMMCFLLPLGSVGLLESRQQSALKANGVIGIGEVIDTQIDTNGCYRIKYELPLNGQTYQPKGFLDADQDFSDCLETTDEVQARQFGTVQLIYLPDDPGVSRLAGAAYFDLGISRFLTTICLGGGLVLPISLIAGWWLWFKRKDTVVDSSSDQAGVGAAGIRDVYPLFSQYEVLNQKIGLVDAQLVPADSSNEYFAQLQAGHDNIDQWIVIDHFGQTPLGKQQVAARVLSETRLQKPSVEAVAALVHNISSHPDYKSKPLTVKFGVLVFEVPSNLKIPLATLLPKSLPKEDYLILSNQTKKIAGFQVQTIIFPTDLDQQVCVIRHDRYPSSGRYPSSKVLDMIQAEANTSAHLQLVVPRKEGRGQKFEVHSSYQTVPTAGFSAAALFAIARAIHAAGLASDVIQLGKPPNEITLFVSDDLTVNVLLNPKPILTRIEYGFNTTE